MTTARSFGRQSVDDATHLWVDHLPTVSLIIPTLNEEANIAHVLARVPEWVYEVLLVDGRSTDGTVEVAQRVFPKVRVIREPRPGKGVALQAGFAAATGDIIAAIDADGSMDPQELHSYVGHLLSGADMVKGSRFVQGGGTVDMEWYRRLGNFGLLTLMRSLFGSRYSDLCYGYFAFWRPALAILSPDAHGFEIETQINVRALKGKLKVAEVPSFEARRLHGVSNLNTFRDGFRILRTILRERFQKRQTERTLDYDA